MPLTNFPNGASSFGIPLVGSGPVIPSGNVWFVSSVTGGTGSGRGTSKQTPFSTLAEAITNCSANKGDVIFCLAGHAETYASAGALTISTAGISIYGLGEGNNRPTFTFGTSAAASIVVTGANTLISNVIGVTAVDALTGPFDIQAAQCILNIEWQDPSAILEAQRAVLGNASADNLSVTLRYIGSATSGSNVNAVRLVGTNGGRIAVDYYGACTTAVVQFSTTASTDVVVTGTFNVVGTTDYSKSVVDTITGSKWLVYGWDAAADTAFAGGNAVAVATAPSITAVTDALYGATGIVSWPTAAAYANNISIAEVLGYVQDGVRRGSGTTMAANKSIADALGSDGTTVTDGAVSVLGAIGVNNANNAFASTSVVSNADGSVLERLEYIQGVQNNQYATLTKADVTAGTGWTTGNSPVTIFTVTGTVLMRCFGVVTTGLTSTGTNGTLSLGVSGNTAVLIPLTVADGTNFATGDVWTATTTKKATALVSTGNWILVNSNVTLTVATNSMTAGGMTVYAQWVPVSSGATVV